MGESRLLALRTREKGDRLWTVFHDARERMPSADDNASSCHMIQFSELRQG